MRHQTLELSIAEGIATVTLNRPDKANAIHMPMWQEIRSVMHAIDDDPAVRVAVITGAGKHFTSGIDLSLLGSVQAEVADPCPGRAREKLRRLILDLQDTLNAIERCRKPMLAAIHGACIGGGIDLVCACDMRYCTADARFSVKEIDMGMTADLGTLQRLPRLIGDGMARELAYTARMVDGAEAAAMRLVNRCFPDREAMMQSVMDIARNIASKSPLSIRGTKEMITYARDHSVADGLNYIATWNAAMLLSDDLSTAMKAASGNTPPRFKD